MSLFIPNTLTLLCTITPIQKYHHARGAALLASGGKVYTGCDVNINAGGADGSALSGERAAVLAAVADGVSHFDCLVVASDTMKSFPTPDGSSREFLRSFGVFPVVLINCEMQVKETSTQVSDLICLVFGA